jgi:tetratricopeptide (TPR) repeat protein
VLERMKELNESLVKDFPGETRYRAGVAGCLHNISLTLDELGRHEDARKTFDRSLQMREKLAREEPEVPRHQGDLAYILLALGRYQLGDGQPDKARETFERSFRIYEGLHSAEPADVGHRRGAALALFELAEMHRASGRWADSARDLGKLCDLLRPVVREDGEKLEIRYELGRALNYRAINVSNLNRPREALKLLAESLEHLRLVYARAPGVRKYHNGLDSALDSLNQIERRLGNLAASVAASLERKTLWANNGHELFRVARDLALTAAAVGRGKKELTPAEMKAKADYQELVLKTLAEAVAAGSRDLDWLETDKVFNELRGREEFQRLARALRRQTLHGPPEREDGGRANP